MAVTYTAKQREFARANAEHLVTIAAGGMEFQGPTSEEERDALVRYLLEFLARRRAEAAAFRAAAKETA